MSRLAHNVKIAFEQLQEVRSALYTCNRLIAGDAKGERFKVEATIQGHFGNAFYNQTHQDMVDRVFAQCVADNRTALLAYAQARLETEERKATRFLAAEVLAYLLVNPRDLAEEPKA